jgi:hypothetical protein
MLISSVYENCVKRPIKVTSIGCRYSLNSTYCIEDFTRANWHSSAPQDTTKMHDVGNKLIPLKSFEEGEPRRCAVSRFRHEELMACSQVCFNLV